MYCIAGQKVKYTRIIAVALAHPSIPQLSLEAFPHAGRMSPSRLFHLYMLVLWSTVDLSQAAYDPVDLSSQNLSSVPLNQIPTDTDFLDVSQNLLTDVDSSTFSGLSNIVILHLSHNLLTTAGIGAGSLSPMPIRTLMLDNNFLDAIPDLSDISGTLKHLYLGYNNITAVLASDFDSLDNVLTLGLQGNRLQTVPSDAFCHMPLKRVFLGYNELYEVPDLTCVATSAHNLDLDHNYICSLRESDFVGFVALKQLSLSGNCLRNILGLGSLRTYTNNLKIYLEDNDLTTLAASLQNFSQVEVLNLSGNNLTPWQPGAFRHSQIDSLYLEASNITCFYLVRRSSQDQCPCAVWLVRRSSQDQCP